jgi:hypothetical protein
MQGRHPVQLQPSYHARYTHASTPLWPPPPASLLATAPACLYILPTSCLHPAEGRVVPCQEGVQAGEHLVLSPQAHEDVKVAIVLLLPASRAQQHELLVRGAVRLQHAVMPGSAGVAVPGCWLVADGVSLVAWDASTSVPLRAWCIHQPWRRQLLHTELCSMWACSAPYQAVHLQLCSTCAQLLHWPASLSNASPCITC